MKKLPTLSLLCMLAMACGKKSDNDILPKQTPAGTPGTAIISGTAYPTVTIGSQTWTAQNYDGAGGSQYNTGIQDVTDVGSYYLPATFNLPTGWRLPSVADYNKLLANFSDQKDANGNVTCDIAATEKLLSNTGWTNLTGNNSSGLNIYPAGGVFFTPANNKFTFDGQGTSAAFLTSNTSAAPDGQYLYLLFVGQASTIGNNAAPVYTYLAEINNNSQVTSYFSVRLVKDN
jgi:uncharacterized protein (TIGR02145 family)